MNGLLQPGGAAVGPGGPLRLVPVALALAAFLPAQATAAAPVVKSEPSLRPGFKRAVSDYVVRCPDRSLTVRVRRARGAKVKVAGRRTRKKRTVAIEPGQARRIVVRKRGRVTRHFVRCLPDDFPGWRFRRVGPQTPRWYVMTPNPRPPVGGRMAAIFDHHGVPVWWYRVPPGPSEGDNVRDARLIGGNIAFAETDTIDFSRYDWAAYRIIRPDGSLVRTVRAVGSPTDFHDLQRLGRDYLLFTYRPREGVDLSAYGGPSDATVLDSEIQRVNRRGRLVWSWSSRDHIGLDETGRMWEFVLRSPFTLADGSKAYDHTHINSVEPAGRGDLIISLRNTDAVYRIRMRDGRVRWKLGGTQTPRSLRVVGDPADYPLGNQHDARLWRGTVTIHDNATDLDRRARVVRYEIDAKRRRAILRERIVARRLRSSFCCGSARKLGNGDWVIGWGAATFASVVTPRGALVNRLRFTDDILSYRTVPARASAMSAASLRAGMNALHAAGAAD